MYVEYLFPAARSSKKLFKVRLSTEGRDGSSHPKPYWEGTPFDDAGEWQIAEWSEQNKDLSYIEMQIKCLNWLLDGEKKNRASDADSYFENILPLEIQILKRELELGMDVKERLAAKEKALRIEMCPPSRLNCYHRNKDEQKICSQVLGRL